MWKAIETKCERQRKKNVIGGSMLENRHEGIAFSVVLCKIIGTLVRLSIPVVKNSILFMLKESIEIIGT